MKRTFIIYKLHFPSAIHISDSRDDYGISHTTLSSDSMYAALTATLAKIYDTLIPDNGDLGCTISSLFPFSGKTLFFPKPLALPPIQLQDATLIKNFKKIQWISLECFEKALTGTLLLDDSYNDHILGSFLYGKEEQRESTTWILKSEVSERVRIKCRTGEEDAEPFVMDRIVFADNAGLYFLAEGDTTLLDKAMALLRHEGIGTDRNVGNGHFSYTRDEVSITIPETADNVILLSSFIPNDKKELEELFDTKFLAYDISRKGGWISTPPHNTIRKNVIYAFTAGSVFANTKAISAGKIVDLKPISLKDKPAVEHPVWRNGKALFLPIKL